MWDRWDYILLFSTIGFLRLLQVYPYRSDAEAHTICLLVEDLVKAKSQLNAALTLLERERNRYARLSTISGEVFTRELSLSGVRNINDFLNEAK